MKRVKHLSAAVATVLAISILLGVCAAAGFDDYPDGKGHWAEAAMRRAVEEGLVNGVDGRLEPDAPATLAQLLTVIARMLEPAKSAETADIGLEGSGWYNTYVLSASSLGLDFDVEKLERGELTRAEACLVLADAFRLIPARPDHSPLEAFTDNAALTGRQRDAMAALVSMGIVGGITEDTLGPNDVLTRAQLFTMLFRIVEKSADAAEPFGGRMLVRSDGDLRGMTFTDPVWLGGSCESVDLSRTRAGTVVVLSQVSDILTDRDTEIDHLILAGGVSDDLTVNGIIDTLTVEGGAPAKVTVAGRVKNVELMAEDVELGISAAIGSLYVGGSGCTVKASKAVDSVEVAGRGNTIVLDKSVGKLAVGGRDNDVSGKGKADGITLTSRSAKCSLNGKTKKSYGVFADMDVELQAEKYIGLGQDLTAKLTLSGPVENEILVEWLVDGEPLRSETVTAGAKPVTLEASKPSGFDSPRLTRHISAVLSSGGEKISVGESVFIEGADTALDFADIELETSWDSSARRVSAAARVTNPVSVPCEAEMYIGGELVDSKRVTAGTEAAELDFSRELSAYPSSGTVDVEVRLSFALGGHTSVSEKSASVEVSYSAKEALATVTQDYAGDYTLEWALAHDYDQAMKTAFVNAMGYKSDTKYLIWVNRTYQRVNIFEGSAGNWTLIHEFLCGTGRPGCGTPVGEYTVWGYDKGWYHSYWCEPVVRFYEGSGYAFHSRLWNPGHETLQDPRIGFPISAGCVRMYDEDIQWMYNNIPIGTKVVVH